MPEHKRKQLIKRAIHFLILGGALLTGDSVLFMMLMVVYFPYAVITFLTGDF